MGSKAQSEEPSSDALIQFSDNTETPILSKEGTVKLSWKWLNPSINRDGWLFELEQSSEKDFNTTQLRYRGSDSATFISGLPKGTFFYRVRAVNPEGQATEWTRDFKAVEVQYVSKKLVLILMNVGSIVFVATSLTVGLGHWRSRQQSV